MKLSIFTTASAPDKRGDAWMPAINCYHEVADEVVVVIGHTGTEYRRFAEPEIKAVYHEWPEEFNWKFIGEQFQRGYEACTGDWVLHMDLDFILHERDFDSLRSVLEDHSGDPALSFWKYQFIQPDRYNLKSRLVLAVNKGRYGDRIKFDSGGDLAQPSLDGKYLSPNDVPEARLPFYNYEKILKTKEQIMKDQGRMDRAWKRHFGEYQLSKDGSDQSAYEGWVEMIVGRYNKPSEQIAIDDHPKVMQDLIQTLEPENFGFNGHGLFETNNYLR